VSRSEVFRLSLLNCMNRIHMLDGNMCLQHMHMFDVDELLAAEFYKMFKLIDLNYELTNIHKLESTSCSSS